MEIKRINTVRDYNQYMGVDTLHPLISVLNFSEVPAVIYFKMYMGVYAVFQLIVCKKLRLKRNSILTSIVKH